jgi:cyclophilin family peptidyl-prolyl cis-trans isomerase/HEAT repeat protein
MISRFLDLERNRPAVSAWLRYASIRNTLALFLVVFWLGAVPAFSQRASAVKPAKASTSSVPLAAKMTLLRAEDERHWTTEANALLADPSPAVRSHAALSAGRIGAPEVVEPLSMMLLRDTYPEVRAMAAFALGETELAAAFPPLRDSLLVKDQPAQVRARAIEALGKIVAAGGTDKASEFKPIADLILSTLAAEGAKGKTADRDLILKGLTAVLRARPEKAGAVLVQFLSWPDARVRADTGNTLSRLRTPEGNERMRVLIKSDPDPVVRANAARVLGATADKTSYDLLLDRAVNDRDQRVRVAAIRSLSALKDPRAVTPLTERALKLSSAVWTISKSPDDGIPRERNELLEIATTAGNLKAGTDDDHWVRSVREVFAGPGRFSSDPEVEIALAKASPSAYVSDDFIPADLATHSSRVFAGWQITSAIAQGLGAITELKEETYGKNLTGEKTKAVGLLRTIMSDPRLSAQALGDLLTAYAAFKPDDAATRVRTALNDPDYVTRGTAAGLLADMGPNADNEKALIEALGPELKNTQANDAALSILDALGKQKTDTANAAIKSAVNDEDIIVRQRAIKLLADNGQGDWSSHLGTVKTQFTDADYQRALNRRDGTVRALVTTTKGAFTIELSPEEAPLTVDNLVMLAKRKYFDRIIFHRVVPNFVIQTGDPRGDGNGGPGYQIRCEINESEYDRGAVGMALSGKDTGGSQWFVTHSPQPHLDGGYTVFGRVAERDMRVVDAIARGDKILSLRIIEPGAPTRVRANRKK